MSRTATSRSAGTTTKASGASGGGYINMVSGYFQQTAGGEFRVRAPNAGFRGVSGGISLSTGTSSFGNSGVIGLARLGGPRL